MIIRTLINDGDEVIVPSPNFVCYAPCAIMSGAKVVDIELKRAMSLNSKLVI